MIGARMYHRIKAVRDVHTIRETSKIVGVSPGTVQKYAKTSLESAAKILNKANRKSQFEVARSFIETIIKDFPKISATKLLRKTTIEYPKLTGKERAFRNFIKPIKEKYANNKIRYYQPVLDRKETSQVQVDPGEIKVLIDETGRELKVYFVVFVFSYSRMSYVSFQERPFNTEDFLKAHLESFQFFGGVAKEYVYDQTKLVVIQEKYREVWFNQKFHQFALKYNFLPIVCEGYDPESKGKVERAVQYVKNDFLYGEYFADIDAVRKGGLEWLNSVANVRIHATTKRKPVDMFAEEKPYLRANYFLKSEKNFRFVDKVGLISFEGNKYSVPFAFQRKQVIIIKEKSTLKICQISDGKEVASHPISKLKGKKIINFDHYSNIKKSIKELEEESRNLLKDVDKSEELILAIKTNNPKHIRPQLIGLQHLINKYDSSYWNEILPVLLELPTLSCSILESNLIAVHRREKVVELNRKVFDPKPDDKKPISSTIQRDLKQYSKKVKNA